VFAGSHPSQRLRAILETSFWVVADRAEVAANVFDLFELVVPSPVESEIMAVEAGFPGREYPYATLFRRLRSQMHDPPPDPPAPLPILGAGEAAANPLAERLSAWLLINERKGAAYARGLGLYVVTVPTFIVTLRARGTISNRTARRKLALITPVTAPAFISEALEILDLLEATG
jgi:hypothetical protein